MFCRAEPDFIVFEHYSDAGGNEKRSDVLFTGSLADCKAYIFKRQDVNPSGTYEYEAEDI